MLRKSVDLCFRTLAHTKLGIATITTTTASRENAAPKNEVTLPTGKFPCYTPEQSSKILETINGINLKKLENYDITKIRANKLLVWQTRHGVFKDVQDILLVEGFSLKVVEKFCKSLLKDGSVDPVSKSVRPRTASFIIPTIDVDQQRRLRSCVSLRIGISSVTWARLEIPDSEQSTNSPCLLTHWQHHDIAEKKLHLHDLMQRCLYVDKLIPTADCYLFENPQTAQVSSNPGKAEQQNINIQKAQITAVLSYALSARARLAEKTRLDTYEVANQTGTVNVFYLRRFLAARLFNHLVGTERVSSEQTIINMMRTYYNLDQQQDALLEEQHMDTSKMQDALLSIRGNIQFPADLRLMFSRAERFHREFLGQTLLLNLAFVRLVLLQDADSIAKVTRISMKGINAGSI